MFAAVLVMASSCGDKNAVDLGLSVKWHTCNLDASAPEEIGGYYTWGGLETQEHYNGSDYRFSKDEDDAFTKYTSEDGLTVLEAADDIATVKLGKKWRMPTTAEVKELVENCSYECVESNGMKYGKFTASNGNFIVFPMAGDAFASFEPRTGNSIRVWTSEISSKDATTGLHLYCTARTCSFEAGAARYIGMQIRPVCK